MTAISSSLPYVVAGTSTFGWLAFLSFLSTGVVQIGLVVYWLSLQDELDVALERAKLTSGKPAHHPNVDSDSAELCPFLAKAAPSTNVAVKSRID